MLRGKRVRCRIRPITLGVATRIGRHLNLLQALPRLWLEFMALPDLPFSLWPCSCSTNRQNLLFRPWTLRRSSISPDAVRKPISWRPDAALQSSGDRFLYREREFLRPMQAACCGKEAVVGVRTDDGFNNVIFVSVQDAPQIKRAQFVIGAVVGIVGGAVRKNAVIDLALNLPRAVLVDGGCLGKSAHGRAR